MAITHAIGDGIVKLTSFDCARVPVACMATIAGQVAAFWDERYVAPEALLSPSRASRFLDLYSLGVQLFEILTGALPYADVAELLRAPEFARFPTRIPPGIDGRWDRIIARLCDFDPERRYLNADAFIDDIERLPGTPDSNAGVAL